MIPLAFLGAVPWRLVGYGAAVGAILLTGWRVHAWREAYKAYPEAVAALKAEEECAAGSKCAARQAALEARQAQVSREVVDGYETELARVRAAAPTTRVVRLCPEKPAGHLRDAGAAAGAGKGTAAAGMVSPGTRPDIGGRLYALAGRADELSAQCRAIIQRDQALAATK